MKTIFLGTMILLPCILILNESEYTIVNLIGFIYIGMIFLLCKRYKHFKSIFTDLSDTLDYYNDKIFKL